VRLSYTSEHQSLALLEYFVHLDKDDPPSDLVLATAEVPDDLSRAQIKPSDLPANWRDPVAPPELAAIGDEFVRKGEHCVLLVPSAIVPAENNWLINPAHPAFKTIVVEELEPVAYDSRMFSGTRGSLKRGRH
jgi:RES domain-containing protein